MAKWCFFLMIVCVVDNAHQYPSNDKEMHHGPSSEEIYDGAAFELCQNILNQITERLKHNGDIYKLLQKIGTTANNWLFGEVISKNWCMSEKSPVHFTWNPGQNCVYLGILDGTLNITEYICDINTVQRVLADPTFDSDTMMEKNAKTKRSLNKQFFNYYINLAKEIEITECSKPILSVYSNQKLVFLNASGVVGNEVLIDNIEVHINVDSTRFTNLLSSGEMIPKRFFISSYRKNYFDAKQDCYNRSMRLLTIKSQTEQDEVMAATTNEHSKFWTSGIESEKEKDASTWYWSEDEKITYMNWISGEPNNPKYIESCISMLEQGVWIDLYCAAETRFICESIIDETIPIVKILLDENVAFQSLPGDGYDQDQSNVVEVKIGVNDDSNRDHTAKFQLLKKNSPQETPFEQRVVIPENFKEDEFNGIDIRIESIKTEGFSCQKDKIYHVHPEEKLNYANAQEFCKNRSMQLVSIQNEQQQSDIEKLLLKSNIDHYYWTSGHLAENGVTWLWNGNEAITYSNWATREPNNAGGNEKCLEIFMPYWKNAKWNDQECLDKNYVICESFSEPYWYLQQV